MITYFIACFGYYISNELNSDYDRAMGNTFVIYHGILDREFDSERFIVMGYFALTTLSTVGYGDLYPISKLELIETVIVMFGGVAFFSYIMSNFIEIIASYTSKISVADKTKELEQFLISMQRFTNNTPLPK